jgi:MYXO-CTERM domain-containing protein
MRTVVALLLLLSLLPAALPVASAQTSGSPPALGALLSDDFDLEFGWTTTPAQPLANTANGWHKVYDGVNSEGTPIRRGWFASRLTAEGVPNGYGNGVTATLTSPAIQVPSNFDVRSVEATVRGSSEDGADLLQLQWAPGEPAVATQWQTLHTWTGYEQPQSYRVEDATSTGLQGAAGAITIRFVFTSDGSCDSDPGTGTGPSPGPPPSAGEAADEFNCPQDGLAARTYVGWHIDRVRVIGRRDFVAAAPATSEHQVITLPGTESTTVDLIAMRGDLLDFRVEETGFARAPFDSVLMRLTRDGTPDVLGVAVSKITSSTWSGLVAVDEPDLVTGSWTMSAFGVKDGSGTLMGTRPLTVTASDVVAPLILVTPASSPGKPVLLGPGDTLELRVLESLLRNVTYTFEGLPSPGEMTEPYSLAESALPEGRSNVTFAAHDRNGRRGAVTVAVDRDTIAPAVTLDAPAAVYADVPFRLGMAVSERSGHTMVLDAAGAISEFTQAGTTGNGTVTTVEITPDGVGPFTVRLAVNDTAGNEAVVVRQFDAVLPVTDLRVSNVRLTSPATNVQREGLSVTASIEQVTGVAPLPVVVTFSSGALSESFNVTVPAEGTAVLTWDTTLPAGPRTITVHAERPAAANETAPGDENGTLAVEVFTGRVTIGSQVYNIRTDSRGLPAQAVLSGSAKTYPLALVNQASGVAYQFTADGNRTVVWDPLQPIQTVDTSAPADDGDKDAPGPGLLLALAVLALALLAQRRR